MTSGFASLTKALEGMFGRSTEELPAELRLRAGAAIAPASWDDLSPEERRESCQIWDFNHDPDVARQFNLRAAIRDKRHEIDKIEMMAPDSHSERESQNRQIDTAKQEVAKLERELDGDRHDQGKADASLPAADVAAAKRIQPKKERALAAIRQVYPDGVPSQIDEPNAALCKKVGTALKSSGKDVSDDTILRAAGRRRE